MVLEFRPGHCGHQALSVRVQGVIKNTQRFCKLYDPPLIHDGYAMRQIAHNGKVMGDKQVRQFKLCLEIRQEVNNLGLD